MRGFAAPDSRARRQMPAVSSLVARGVAWCGIWIAACVFAWILTGAVRDVGFAQIALYPVQCLDVGCDGSQPLPRMRFAVDRDRGDVIYWIDRSWLGAFADADVYRLTECIVLERGTWSCRSPDNARVFAFEDGVRLRIDALPAVALQPVIGKGAVRSVRFVGRMDWYRRSLAAW